MAGPKNQAKIARENLEVPNIRVLAKIYRDSLEESDRTIADAAEGIAIEVANAEAALTEAVTMTRFIDDAAV